ncbi:SDR family NAD(P)-dependent oxidoreductase [Aquabacterium parvum]|uniref:SDR family NAD(P)-dependent oxidoreductase n=1 Tax=Aquabacterium parvum TaxID=70584 RepID=UPI000718BBD7|nr:SDR family oxidoreductase [Aquabacterium parvum]
MSTHGERVALITGAAGGIGRALVAVFEAQGWRVVSTDRVALDRASHVVGSLADLSSPDTPGGAALIAALRAETGGELSAIVHNAAFQVVKPTDELSPEDWQTTLNVNLMAPFWLTQAFLPELKARHGSVLAISSIHERLTKPGFVAYATSKSALSGMVRAMAVDLGGQVRVNAICPAAIGTPMLKAGFDGQPQAFAQLEAHHPIGRIGTPEEVAELAAFVCSDRSPFMTGACLDLSGGISGRLHDPV